MKSQDDETEIRLLFDKLREEDAKEFPSFHQVLSRSPAKQERRSGMALFRGYRWVPALAAVMVVLVSLVIIVDHHNASLDRGQTSGKEITVAKLMDWEAPTDFLLAMDPGDDSFLESVPSLGTETIEWDDADAVLPDSAQQP
ncbi:MAG: hypothetical protein P8Z74_01185 [Acidobacteriota bacterium]|jgi:hypothetical protein